MASSLPRRYSTTELRGRRTIISKKFYNARKLQDRWSGKRDSNPQPSAWKADALPLSYSRFYQSGLSKRPKNIRYKSFTWWRGEDSNLRRLSRQIYSLFPLAAREPLHYTDINKKKLFYCFKTSTFTWSSGALELWSSGALELWSSGALELWSSGGALELWSSGALELAMGLEPATP